MSLRVRHFDCNAWGVGRNLTATTVEVTFHRPRAVYPFDVQGLTRKAGSNYSRTGGLSGYHHLCPAQRKLSLFPLAALSDHCGTNIESTIFVAQVFGVWVARMGDSLDPKQRDAADYLLTITSSCGAFTFTSTDNMRLDE